jgi:hypothetical protein
MIDRGPIRPPVSAGVREKAKPADRVRGPRRKEKKSPDMKEYTRQLFKSRLGSFFAEAKNVGETLWPDEALRRLQGEISLLVGDPSKLPDPIRRKARISPKSAVARQKELHLEAVEQFYKIYFPDASGRGRPRLPDEDREEVRQLREADVSWNKIPEMLGDPGGARASEKLRKRAMKTPRKA